MTNRVLLIAVAKELLEVQRVHRAVTARKWALVVDDKVSGLRRAASQPWRWILITGGAHREMLPNLVGKVHMLTRVPVLASGPSLPGDVTAAIFRAGASDVLNQLSFDAELDAALLRLGLAPERDALAGVRLHGESSAIRHVRSLIDRVAPHEANVLITGETGTGKEVAAALIHQASARRGFPLVSINCAALPEGLLESELFGHERGAFTGAHTARDGRLEAARGGTVFLDEIGDMSLSAQAKMLRAIENRQVTRLGGTHEIPLDIRVIAATNQDLETMVAEKRFREDLYYRLNVARIHLPPLRERREDIRLLVRVIARELAGSGAVEVEPELVDKLTAYAWPGNVREVRNLMESMFIFRSIPQRLQVADLPAHLHSRVLGTAVMPDDERTRILAALTSAEWNKSRAARVLHCSRMTLYRKMTEHGIAEEPAEALKRAAVTASASGDTTAVPSL